MAAKRIVVCDYSDLPVITSHGHRWGRSVLPLVRRIRSYMTGGMMEPEFIDVDRSRRVHMAYEPARASEWDGWHLPFADIIAGRPYAVYRAISAIIGLVNGARGGLDQMLSGEQQDRVWNQCQRYYAKWTGAEMPERAVAKTAESVGAANGFFDRVMMDLVQRGTYVTEELVEPLMTPDLGEQIAEAMATLEQQLERAQAQLAKCQRQAAATGSESYRGDIQRFRAEVRQLQELLGIEPEAVHDDRRA